MKPNQLLYEMFSQSLICQIRGDIILVSFLQGSIVFPNCDFICWTSAAGDVFNGALVVALSEGKEMIQAVRFANAAAAISVTRLGAQASAPRRSEAKAGLAALMKNNNMKAWLPGFF